MCAYAPLHSAAHRIVSLAIVTVHTSTLIKYDAFLNHFNMYKFALIHSICKTSGRFAYPQFSCIFIHSFAHLYILVIYAKMHNPTLLHDLEI